MNTSSTRSPDFESEQACHTMDLTHRNLADYTRCLRLDLSYLRRLDERHIPEDRRAELASLKVKLEQARGVLNYE